MNAFLGALCAGLALLQTPELVDVGVVRVGERDVRVTLPPPASAPEGPVIEFNGWKFPVNESGHLGQPYRVDGAWGDIADLWKRAQEFRGTPVEWRTRVMVFSRGEVLQRHEDGVVRTNRFSLERREIDHVYESLALAKVAFEGRTGGRARVVFDVSVEETPLQDYASFGGPSWSTDVARAVRTRMNSQRFETDEGRFLGPYRGSLVITCLPGFDTPNGPLPYYRFRPASEPLAFASRLIRALEDSVWQSGASWLDATALSPTSEAEEAARLQWTRLVQEQPPVEDTERRSFGLQGRSLPWATVRHDWANEVPYDTTAMTLEGFRAAGDRSLLGTSIEVADVLSTKLGDRLKLIGGAYGRVLFEMDAMSNGPPTARLAGYDGPLPQRTFGSWSDTLAPLARGTLRVEQLDDPERGTVLRITDQGHFRDGEVRLLGGYGMRRALDEPASLVFEARSTSPIGFAVRASSPQGLELDAMVLGSLESGSVARISTPFEADGAWHTVRVDLTTLTRSSKELGSIWIVPATNAKSVERGFQGPVSIEIARVRIVPGDAPTLTDGPRSARTTAAAREFAAYAQGSVPPEPEARQRLIAATRDAHEVTRLNALDALALWPGPDALPVLLDASRSSSPATAHLAIRALAALSVPAAWSRIREATLQGPFEHARRSGAQFLGAAKAPNSAATLSTLLTGVHWTTRLAGAKAITQLPEPNAAIVSLVFLRDPEPIVREALVQGVSLTDEVVGRRLLFVAVNDASEAVRLAAWIRLLESARPEWRQEAFRAVRNESLHNRSLLARRFGELARDDDTYLPGVVFALSDRDPRVRAAAVEALGAKAIAEQAATRETILGDTSPFVQVALLRIVLEARVTLPEETIRALAVSPYPVVRDLARTARAP